MAQLIGGPKDGGEVDGDDPCIVILLGKNEDKFACYVFEDGRYNFDYVGKTSDLVKVED